MPYTLQEGAAKLRPTEGEEAATQSASSASRMNPNVTHYDMGGTSLPTGAVLINGPFGAASGKGSKKHWHKKARHKAGLSLCAIAWDQATRPPAAMNAA